MKSLKIIFPILFSILILSCTTNNLQPRQGYFNMPDGKIWYEVYGSGTKTPLLLNHGGPGARSCYMSTIKGMAENRPIIFYDQLGSGRSEVTTDTTIWTLPCFVNDLDRLIDSLELDEVHLLGHSWGCAIAVDYYLTKKSDIVKSIILSGTYLSTKLWMEDANYLRSQLPDSIQQVMTYHENNGTTDSDEYLSATAFFYDRHYSLTNPRPHYTECEGSKPNLSIYNYMWGPNEFLATGTLINYDRIDRLGEIEVPVLLIAGEYDEARPETVSKLQKLFPNAHFKIVEDAAHAIYIDNPDEYNNTINDFLTTVE